MRQTNQFQNTGAWFNERTGKLTASRMAAAMSYLKNGNEGADRRKLKIEILAERLTGNIVSKYVTSEMQWGVDTEPMAKDAFEQRYFKDFGELMIVQDVGFLDHPRIPMCGASPDGFCTDERIVEVKCPSTATHLNWLLEGEIPAEYRPQMCLQSSVTGRDVWFVSYDPRLPEKQSLFYKLYEPTPAELAQVEEMAVRFLDEVEMMFDKITRSE